MRKTSIAFYVTAITAFVFGAGTVTAQTESLSQTNDYQSFDVSTVFDSMTAGQSHDAVPQLIQDAGTWWDQHVVRSQRSEAQPIPMDIHSLMYLALKYSNQIRIAAEDPVIRETAINEADANFDWVRYLDSSWNDTSEPISSALTTGDASRFFSEETFQTTAGLRRTNRNGGQLNVSQRFGWQDNNSSFFVPANQANGQLTVSYSHPLLRGSGVAYNTSLVVLSQLDSGIAHDEFLATLQDHLLEVTRSYWALYQQRATLAQQTSLFLKTQDIVRLLKARQAIDAQQTQLITASSALETRAADLIRARTAVVNAETRLRGLINAPELNVAAFAEIVPVEKPGFNYLNVNLQSELQTAIQHRPEIHAAIKEIRSATVRLGVAQNEILPLLNVITEGYLSGLRGDSEFGGSFKDQFTTGAPSYSIGVQYELPIGNRLAKSRLTRRRVELRQLQRRYQQALTAVQTEVDIAVRETNTSYREIIAKRRALKAAESEAKTIEARWSKMTDGSGSSSLNLESLLRAQERVAEMERDYTQSLLTYNLSIINLKQTNGTLLHSENVVVGRESSVAEAPSLFLGKSGDYSDYSVQQTQYTQRTQYADPIPAARVLEHGQPTLAAPHPGTSTNSGHYPLGPASVGVGLAPQNNAQPWPRNGQQHNPAAAPNHVAPPGFAPDRYPINIDSTFLPGSTGQGGPATENW